MLKKKTKSLTEVALWTGTDTKKQEEEEEEGRMSSSSMNRFLKSRYKPMNLLRPKQWKLGWKMHIKRYFLSKLTQDKARCHNDPAISAVTLKKAPIFSTLWKPPAERGREFYSLGGERCMIYNRKRTQPHSFPKGELLTETVRLSHVRVDQNNERKTC